MRFLNSKTIYRLTFARLNCLDSNGEKIISPHPQRKKIKTKIVNLCVRSLYPLVISFICESRKVFSHKSRFPWEEILKPRCFKYDFALKYDEPLLITICHCHYNLHTYFWNEFFSAELVSDVCLQVS